jgi:hypothetical protein
MTEHHTNAPTLRHQGLYPREAEIARRLSQSEKHWRRIAVELERQGLPQIDPVMKGRFWPAVEALTRRWQGPRKRLHNHLQAGSKQRRNRRSFYHPKQRRIRARNSDESGPKQRRIRRPSRASRFRPRVSPFGRGRACSREDALSTPQQRCRLCRIKTRNQASGGLAACCRRDRICRPTRARPGRYPRRLPRLLDGKNLPCNQARLGSHVAHLVSQ